MAGKTRFFWHFIRVDGTTGQMHLGYDDKRPVQVGQRMRYEKVPGYEKRGPTLCVQGMHASTRIMDAMRYATGRRVLTKVTLHGRVKWDSDKVVAQGRTIVQALDAETTRQVVYGWAEDVMVWAAEKGVPADTYHINNVAHDLAAPHTPLSGVFYDVDILVRHAIQEVARSVWNTYFAEVEKLLVERVEKAFAEQGA